MASEAILAIMEEMLLSDCYSLEDIVDEGFITYAEDPHYAHCDRWFVIDVDLSCLP